MKFRSLSDLWGIAEGNCKEQGRNCESENEDVSEAFHRDTPWRELFEGTSCGRNVTLWKTASGFVAEFLEQTEFNLISEIGINTCEHIAVQSPSSMPDMAEEEQQSESCMSKREPATG